MYFAKALFEVDIKFSCQLLVTNSGCGYMKSVNRLDSVNRHKSVTRGKTSPGIVGCLHEARANNFPSVTRGRLC